MSESLNSLTHFPPPLPSVEAARPPHPSEPTTFRNLILNPFSKLNNARKFRKICKEYKQLVQVRCLTSNAIFPSRANPSQHISQVARAERYLLFTSSEENGSLSQSFRPVVKASHANGVQILVTQEVALEIGNHRSLLFLLLA